MENTNYPTKHLEKLSVSVCASPEIGSKLIAEEIASLIKENQAQNKSAVLGLATGSSPIEVYDELIRMHKEEGLSFKNVITFNLDEYFPMQPDALQSYAHFQD